MNIKNVLSVLLMHLLLIFTIVYYPLTPISFLCFIILYWMTGCLGISLAYHRLLSHRSFSVPIWLEYILVTCGALALQLGPSKWVHIHRHHHIHSDTKDDPHSPCNGFLWGYALWLFSNKTYNVPVSSDGYYRFLDKYYAFLQIPLIIILYSIGGVGCVLWGTVARICFVWHLSWMNNAVAHLWGNRYFITSDNSRNNLLLAIFTFGEGWHNNHHTFPNSAKLGILNNQLDIGWMHIKALEWFGLVRNIHIPTQSILNRKVIGIA